MRGLAGTLLCIAALAACDTRPAAAIESAGAAPETPKMVTALGRIEPHHGIVRIAGPSRSSPVIAKLLVEEGDRVRTGDPIATLDTFAEDQAHVARAKAELANAETELGRTNDLFRKGIAAPTSRDAAQLKVDVAKTEVQAAQATFDLDTVRAPINGQIVEIHARAGERVGAEGVAELADIDHMYAVAEVYETDIGRVKIGHRATMKSPALQAPLTGAVERIGTKIGKLDVLDTDPAARTDARVVEVEIKLDDSTRGAALSNLQVDVAIQTD